MSETKFTPGPWKAVKCVCVAEKSGDGPFVTNTDPPIEWEVHAELDPPNEYHKLSIATTETLGIAPDRAVRKANARLIAAAPDLYEALEGLMLLVDLEDPWDKDSVGAWIAAAKAARSALIKADWARTTMSEDNPECVEAALAEAKSAAERREMFGVIDRYIVKHFGERCSTVEGGCRTCAAWASRDVLNATCFEWEEDGASP